MILEIYTRQYTCKSHTANGHIIYLHVLEFGILA